MGFLRALFGLGGRKTKKKARRKAQRVGGGFVPSEGTVEILGRDRHRAVGVHHAGAEGDALRHVRDRDGRQALRAVGVAEGGGRVDGVPCSAEDGVVQFQAIRASQNAGGEQEWLLRRVSASNGRRFDH